MDSFDDSLTLPQYVAACIRRRGYGPRPDETERSYVVRQFLKAVEELGEAARYVFDGQVIPAEEIADVLIPLLGISETYGYDIEATIRCKVTADIERGVR